MFFNKAIIIGNVTRDPEMKALPSGAKVTSLSIATNRVWKDQNGAKKEQTDFHNIVVFGRQAETVAQYVKKGSMLMVEGRIQTRSWDGQDGKKNYRTEIVADRVQFGPRTGTSGGGSTVAGSQDPQSNAPGNKEVETIEYPDDDINAEDIPF
ncbi:MAG: single-stranded DNA-binding protein [Candidatus Pacebacteria bacterium]|nr:single-stranded DNA-binding protein [Candidatus Paceibacterota bacterium]